MTYLQKSICGLPAAIALGVASLVSAETTTPGIPETDGGGDSTLLFVVLGIAALAIMAGVYLASQREPTW